ncbi:MAG: hypothetical protein DRJ10_08355 [Bacteroidetes bacterium]|nr:MAG: hypothetical protein DRJ10_08355 [Bacteroidota bacterium]
MKTLEYKQFVVGSVHDSTLYASETTCPYFIWPLQLFIGSKGCRMCDYHKDIDYNKQTVLCNCKEEK